MQKSASLIIFLIFCAVNGFGVSDPVIKAKSGSIGKHEGNQLLEQAISKIKNLEFDEARTLLEECIIWGTTASDSILLASSYYYLGDCFYYLQDFDKAMECYQGNLSLVEQIGDTLLIARTLNSIGIIHNLKLDFDLAINNFILAVNLIDQCAAKNIVLNSEKINSLVNINNIYIDLGEYDKVIKNAFKIIELSKTINDKRNLGLAYNNLGISYSNQGKFQEAKESYFQTMSLLMETGNKHELSFVYNNLGNLYEKTMEYDSALYYLNLSHDQFKKSGNNIGIARAQVGIASVLTFLNRPDDARQIYLETIKTYNDDTHHQTLLIAYKGLHELEYQQGNYKMAYQYLIKYTSMTDSIFSIEQSQLISELQTKYETDIKEAELNLLKSEKQQRETILKMNRWLSWLGFSSAVMFLALTFYTLSQLIQKRKANIDLKNKNELIEDINDQLIELNNEISNINNKLQESENELKKSNNSKDMFFSIIAHELRNPFHHVLLESEFFLRDFRNLSDLEKINTAKKINQTCCEVHQLLENLLEWARSQTKSIAYKPISLGIKEAVEHTLATLKNSAEKKGISLTNNIKRDYAVMADLSMLDTILRNLVSNAIKFTHPSGWVSVSSEIKNKQIELCVEDNGVGISSEKKAKLFQIDQRTNTCGTAEERGSGLGLNICKEFLNYHNGEIRVDSEPGKGSKFYITLPLDLG